MRPGADDIAGQFLIYGGEVISSIVAGVDLPSMPGSLAGLVAGKLSGVARGVLIVAETFLTILQIQVMPVAPMGIAPSLRSIVIRSIEQFIALMGGVAVALPNRTTVLREASGVPSAGRRAFEKKVL